MAPTLLTKIPMTPLRVMGMVVGVAVICLVFSAFKAPTKSLKLGAALDQPPAVAGAAAAAAALHVKRDNSGRTMADSIFWQTFDFQSDSIPLSVEEAALKVVVTTNYTNILGTNTFYREAKPPAEVVSSGEVVVLLHGAAFKSATWLKLNTINLLAGMGHRVIALDLPGFGNSTQDQVKDRLEYLSSLLNKLDANQIILVSPSMSGSFSIPFLIKYPEALTGYVPVAPVGTENKKDQFQKLKVPTLIIYGSKDTGLGYSSRDDLSNIPTSQAVELPDAKHPAYIDKPNMFHTLLYNFIKQVRTHRAIV